ncbi:antitoxin VbhA family protein [Salinibacterium sp. ZJ454]|uniref:antitoxin VbhA family protein n=1 Tax=Salinibacterium sp. ZJ454 TaxID=2708339 RepID=UPI00141DAEDA|nr:antitoxin VbhA family protein [Salinibacterium sp. ZJ454]
MTSERRPLSPEQVAQRLVEIRKGQELGGHHPSADALDRARRILVGEITADEARAEILAKYSEPDPSQ